MSVTITNAGGFVTRRVTRVLVNGRWYRAKPTSATTMTFLPYRWYHRAGDWLRAAVHRALARVTRW